MFDYQRKGYSQYGASMGRRSGLGSNTSDKCLIRQVPIDDQGYDPGGAYWGAPNTLYYIESLDSGEVCYLRSKDLQSARSAFPEAVWVEGPAEGDLDDMVTAFGFRDNLLFNFNPIS